MTENKQRELTDFEHTLAAALQTKADSSCPSCGNNSFFFLGPTAGPWVALCCQRCGLKTEYLIDILMGDLEAEEEDVD